MAASLASRWATWELAGRPVNQATPLSPVTFPTTTPLLVIRARLALGADLAADPSTWLWQEITEWVRYAPAIVIVTGRRDESATVTTGSARLTLDNRDGRFSRRNPAGPWYGLLTKNTPIWIEVDPGDGMHTVCEMFVNEWPTRWDRSGIDSFVPITCAGAIRRLQAGQILQSPLRAGLAATNPTAWWPLEGGLPISALEGGRTMYRSGQIQYATQTGCPGAGPLPDFTGGGSMWAPLPAGNSTTEWRIEFVVRFGTGSDTVGAGDFTVPVRMLSPSGTVNLWELLVSAGNAVFQWSDTSGSYTSLLDSGVDVDDGEWHHISLTAAQSGGNISVSISVDDSTPATSSLVGKTLDSTKSSIYVNPDQEVATYVGSVGHLVYWAPFSSTVDTAYIARGYDGEQAHIRIERVCGEAGVPYYSVAGESVTMGPQPTGDLLTVCRDAEAVDRGVLYEKGWGLAYQSRAERENAIVRLALDFNQRHIAVEPEPADDDQRTRNLWRVSRPGGSESTYEQTTGVMGTATIGTWEDSTSTNTETDTQLLYQASHRVLFGTVDEERWPSISLRLHVTADLIPAYPDLPFGSRVQISNPPSQVAPDTIDIVVEGKAERIDTTTWGSIFNAAPFSPYHTFRLAESVGDVDAFLGYLTPTTCVLAEDLDTTETAMDITTDPLWSTDSDDWTPGARIRVGGEVMLVTAVSGGSNPQTLTVTRSVNNVIKEHSSGAAVEFDSPGALGL